MSRIVLLLGPLMFLGCASAKSAGSPAPLTAPTATPSLLGSWAGLLVTPNGNLHLQLTFRSEDRGVMLSVDQSARELPVTVAERRGSHVTLDVQVPGSGARVEGTLAADTLEGTFSQSGNVLPVSFKRTTTPVAMHATAHDTDAYTEQLVTVPHGSITLAGTLTLPRGFKHPPVVVLITASGAQDRDETVLGIHVFGMLADALARHGVAVLRQDDRGVAESTGDFKTATTEDFATDTEAAVRYLQTRTDLALGSIGLIGHSEGAMIAPLVASRMPAVKFVVLLAPPAEPGADLLVDQAEAIEQSEGVPAKQVEENTGLQRRMFAALQAGQPLNTLEKDLPSWLTKEQFEKRTQGVTSPWFLYFLRSDPEAVLRKLTVPTLALFGSLDTQVPAVTNAPRLRAALAQAHNPHATVTVLPGLNHLYQRAQTGSPAEYARLEKKVDASMLDAVTTWMTARQQ